MTDHARPASELPELDRPDLAGIHPLPRVGADAIRIAAEAIGYDCMRVDLDACTDKASLLQRIAAGLRFPHWFGHNWDALADCLSDLGWLPGAGHVVILAHADALRSAAPDAWHTALEVFADASREQAAHGIALWVFIDTPEQRSTNAASDAARDAPCNNSVEPSDHASGTR
ncbi:barstar family protein [Rhodocyclaceae bacterium SMB388]